MTQNSIHKIFIPQKIFVFLKTQNNIEIQNFEPQKITRAYVCMKISEYPPPPPPPGAENALASLCICKGLPVHSLFDTAIKVPKYHTLAIAHSPTGFHISVVSLRL